LVTLLRRDTASGKGMTVKVQLRRALPRDLIADVRAAQDSWFRFAAEAGLGDKTVEAIAGEFEMV